METIIRMNDKTYKITRLREFNNLKGDLVPSCDAEWLYKGNWYKVKCEQILINLRKRLGK